MGLFQGAAGTTNAGRWILLIFQKRSRKSIKAINVLVAVDNFDRTIFTQAMPGKSAQNTLDVFRKIIGDNDGVMAKQITVDLGNEYALLEQEVASKGGVLTRKNMQAVNTLAVVDRVISKIKVILSAYSLTNWADSLKRATRVYNEKRHSYLMGSAPEDVKASTELQYELGFLTIKNGGKKQEDCKTMAPSECLNTGTPGNEWMLRNSGAKYMM